MDQRKKLGSKKKFFWKLVIFFVVIGMCGILGVVGLFISVSYDLPDIKELEQYSPAIPSQILSKDGEVLLSVGREKRELVQIGQIPQVIINAFLSAEDSNFYSHRGVDYMGIMRALLADIKARKIVQGGSTITQQVAKSLLLSREQSISRKLKDIILAHQIEQSYSKDEILYLYLNHIYLGGGYYGVKAAFKGYFNKELEEGTIAESALVAGLLVAPGKYSPYLQPEYSKRRQRYVLGRMLETQKISEQEYEEAMNEEIKIYQRARNPLKGGYFTDFVRQKVIQHLGEEKFLTGGLRIITSLDWELQQIAEKSVLEGVKEIDKRQGYKGPLGHLDDENEILNYLKTFRKKIYEKKSHFFTLTTDGKKSFELKFDEDYFRQLLEKYRQKMGEKNLYHFWPGNVNDKLQELIGVEQNYHAIVEKVSRKQGMIYVSIGGIKGIIPSKYFSWAHERTLNEERHYHVPVRNPNQVVKRRDIVLVKVLKKNVSPYEYFLTEYKNQISNKKLANDIKNEEFLLCSLDQEPVVQGSLISLNVHNGEIISMVGGSDFNRSQFNRAVQALRQPGSAFKPFLFAAALENGKTPADTIVDSPEALGGVDDLLSWKPKNYNGQFTGLMTLRNALEKSQNVPTIKLAHELGVSKMMDYVKRIGLQAQLDPDLSFSLGSFGVTLLNLTASYSIFANGGNKVQPKAILSITDPNGKIFEIDAFQTREDENLVEKEETETNKEKVSATLSKEDTPVIEINPYHINLDDKYVYDNRLAYIMSNLLRGVVAHGTGRRAASAGKYIGAKTGTTNSYKDAWFLGFNPMVSTGVWAGFDDNMTMGWPETGAKAALPIWVNYMKAALKKYGEIDFKIPKGIVNVLINKNTGEMITGGSDGFMESFVEGTGPNFNSSSKENFYKGPGGQDDDIEILDDDYYSNQ